MAHRPALAITASATIALLAVGGFAAAASAADIHSNTRSASGLSMTDARAEAAERAEAKRGARSAAKAEFTSCRESTEGSKRECAQVFSAQMRVAAAERHVELLRSKVAMLAELPADERPAATARLERRIDRALDRLELAEERLVAAKTAGTKQSKSTTHSEKPGNGPAEHSNGIGPRAHSDKGARGDD
jgi:hypothetical protein